ncbi:MAG: hypothetical protein NDJ19_11335 [Ramlibacter sp.]|nr:hypothetical protein [Ramlibacter sp.]
MTQILTLVVKTDDGCVETHFGIEHEGKLWLVTSWLTQMATGQATPERMIRVDTQPLEKCAPGGPFHYTNILLPREVIEGTAGNSSGYEVRDFPDAPVVGPDDLKILPSVFPRH